MRAIANSPHRFCRHPILQVRVKPKIILLVEFSFDNFKALKKEKNTYKPIVVTIELHPAYKIETVINIVGEGIKFDFRP